MPYIARNRNKGAAVVILQEFLIHKGTKTEVRREFKHKFPEYDCYIAAGDHLNVGKDDNDVALIEEYARSAAQITVVTFLHKRVFQGQVLVKNWHQTSENLALEHMSRGCVLWLEAKTHDKVSISIVNIHQATAGSCDLQKQVNHHINAMIDRDTAPGQRRIMGSDFNAVVSRHGYAESTRSRFERVDKQFQDFVKSTGFHKAPIESVAHTRRDLVRGSSASLDHIIA